MTRYISYITGESRTGRPVSVMLLLVTGVLWSFGGLLIKLISWNPLAIAGMRSLIAILMLFLLVRRPHFTWSPAQIFGALCYSSTVILFVFANKMTTAANAILLQYSAPIFVAILGIWFLNEHLKIFDWVIIACVICGMLLFFFEKLTPGGFYGNILAIVSGVSFAGLHIFMRKQKDGSPIETILLGNIATAVIGIPFMLQSFPNLTSWIGLILLGIFQLGLSYICYSIAIRNVKAIDAVLILTFEPILNPIWVFLFIGEIPGVFAIAGGFIVVASVTIRCIVSLARAKY
jgi:drug/metabolite transporter (DMT)-like permease